MSFVVYIGTLMGNIGLSDLLKLAFEVVEKMILGKILPQNTRAVHILCNRNTTVYLAG